MQITVSKIQKEVFEIETPAYFRDGSSFVKIVDESYTSKTCGVDGYINFLLGSKEVFICPKCGLVIDRDLHASRNIYLKNT